MNISSINTTFNYSQTYVKIGTFYLFICLAFHSLPLDKNFSSNPLKGEKENHKTKSSLEETKYKFKKLYENSPNSYPDDLLKHLKTSQLFELPVDCMAMLLLLNWVYNYLPRVAGLYLSLHRIKIPFSII